MRGLFISAAYVLLGCGPAIGQEANLKFEVASVRPSTAATATPANSRMSGGPGTPDPERLTYTNIGLKTILLKAYGVLDYRLSGPDWLNSTRFDIVAKVPPGATEAQLASMLQNLLVERFNMSLHHEPKEMAVYELTVGKNGSKLKDADLVIPPQPEREPGSRPPTIGLPDKEGFPQIPSGRPMMLGRMTDGIMRWTGKVQAVSDLAGFLGSELERPVVDKTGLTGKYDFSLAYSRDGLRQRQLPAGANAPPVDDTPSGGVSLLKAVQDQLGLNLEAKKDPVDVLVIDRIDRQPTEN
jgi:uncharacterized protein (TIGR03435 family)